jgi:hypothetical protein
MRQLHRRVQGLEAKRHPPKLHIVCCYGEQSSDHSLDEYGQDRIGSEDDLIVVIRKPWRPACN